MTFGGFRGRTPIVHLYNDGHAASAQKGGISCSRSGGMSTCIMEDGKTYRYRTERRSAAGDLAGAAGAGSLSAYHTTTKSELSTAVGLGLTIVTLGADLPLLGAMGLATIPYVMSPSTEGAIGIAMGPLKPAAKLLDETFYYGGKVFVPTINMIDHALNGKGLHDFFRSSQ